MLSRQYAAAADEVMECACVRDEAGDDQLAGTHSTERVSAEVTRRSAGMRQPDGTGFDFAKIISRYSLTRERAHNIPQTIPNAFPEQSLVTQQLVARRAQSVLSIPIFR